MIPDLILFFGLALVAVASAIGLLLSKSAVYAALNLIINFTAIAIFYLLLGAPFLFSQTAKLSWPAKVPLDLPWCATRRRAIWMQVSTAPASLRLQWAAPAPEQPPFCSRTAK